MKYTFKSEDDGIGGFTNTVEFEANHIDDVIANFELFLKGSGFHFGGVLDFQEEGVTEFDEPDAPDLTVWNSMIDTLTQESVQEPEIDESVNCIRCGISKSVMQGATCWDNKCPLEKSV
jgi:hypothetical protein